MTFGQTGLPWVMTSPHIPYPVSAELYPVTGIMGELYVMSIGVGYTLPFQLIAADWVDGDKLAANLNSLKLPGVLFRPVHFTPYYSVAKGTLIHGVQIHITDISKANLTLVQFYAMQELHSMYPDKNLFEMCNKSRISMFDKVCGSDKVRLAFTKNFQVSDIREMWMKDVAPFRVKAKKYYLYR